MRNFLVSFLSLFFWTPPPTSLLSILSLRKLGISHFRILLVLLLYFPPYYCCGFTFWDIFLFLTFSPFINFFFFGGHIFNSQQLFFGFCWIQPVLFLLLNMLDIGIFLICLMFNISLFPAVMNIALVNILVHVFYT